MITVTSVDYRAERAGELPAAGATVGGVALPPGHVAGAMVWVSDEPVSDVGTLWSDLAARFPETGLWPLVLEPFEADGRRWWDGELDPTLSRQPGQLDDVDLESTLSDWWSEHLPVDEELEDPEFAGLVDESLAPFGLAFPGVADPPAGEPQPETTMPVPDGHLGLVAVERPADAPVVMGWLGPINYYNDVGPLSVVLRSWEDRYDAVVVGLGLGTLSMVVRRPPQNPDDAAGIAAEHYAACPDLVVQGAGSIEDYASMIEGQSSWQFWWD